MKRILFVYTKAFNELHGGVQRVSLELGNALKSAGYTCFFYTTDFDGNSSFDGQIFWDRDYSNDRSGFILHLRRVLIELRISTVINQAALGGTLVSEIYDASRSLDIRIVSVIHNMIYGPLNTLGRISQIPGFSSCLRTLYTYKNRSKYLNIANYSDRVILLSEGNKREFEYITGIVDDNRFGYINNPVTIESNIRCQLKENVCLYVGRLNDSQKGIIEMLRVWKNVVNKEPRWDLIIIGEGPDRRKIERYIDKNSIPNVKLLGRMDPTPYYRISTFYLMTSRFEGWPLTLFEAMINKCIPVLYNSFPAANNIVSDRRDGYLINNNNRKEFIRTLLELMKCDEELNQISSNAQLKAKRFDTGALIKEWQKVLR